VTSTSGAGPTLPPSKVDRYRWFWRWLNRTESLELRWLGFCGMSVLRRTPVLLLETTGRRTGRRHRAGVAYWEGDGVYNIGGGAGGMTRVDWVANLRAKPDATMWVRRQKIAVEARELVGDEEEHARAEAFKRWPGAPKYEEISGRRIPYFELRPVSR
jgi:deazaflavin-dependent oxidoreductase (nitroreductase family)